MGEEKTKKLKAKVAFKHELEKDWLLSSYAPEPGEVVFYDAETGDGDLPAGRSTPYTCPRIKVGALDKDGNKISVNYLPFAITDNRINISPTTRGGRPGYREDVTISGAAIVLDGKGTKVVLTKDGLAYENGDDEGADYFATEAYADSAAAQALTDAKAYADNSIKDITTNSIIIGEGEAADLSIAGGTTDTSFFVATIKSNSALMEKINENPAGAMILELLESGNISAETLNTINTLLGTNYSIVKSKAGETMSISLGTSNESAEVGAITLGYGNKSSGFSSSAIGSENTVEGSGALAYGHGNTVSSDFGTAFGQENEAGYSALVSGIKNKATGKGSFASGYNNTASAPYSTATGDGTTASGNLSHAEGLGTTASGDRSHAEGYETIASGTVAHTEGVRTKASARAAHAEGYETIASGERAHTEGHGTKASGDRSHAEGFMSIAEGEASHAEGSASSETNDAGEKVWVNPTTASGMASHAEGISTNASGKAAHTEGANTIVAGTAGHAEGAYTEVYAKYAHAGGVSSWVDSNADNAFVHGDNSVINEGAKRSVAFGFHTEANYPDQFVIGRYNDSSDENIAFAIGNGTKDSQRSNAFEVRKDGTASINGSLKIGNTIITED